MPESKHAPTPFSSEYFIMDANGKKIGFANDPDIQSFIVRACNSHYDLLTACQKVVNNWGDLHDKDLMQLRAAIAKAEGRA